MNIGIQKIEYNNIRLIKFEIQTLLQDLSRLLRSYKMHNIFVLLSINVSTTSSLAYNMLNFH